MPGFEGKNPVDQVLIWKYLNTFIFFRYYKNNLSKRKNKAVISAKLKIWKIYCSYVILFDTTRKIFRPSSLITDNPEVTHNSMWVGGNKHLCVYVGCLYVYAVVAATKSLQLCLTLCDCIDSSPPGSSLPEILQARTLEWAAISFPSVCV